MRPSSASWWFVNSSANRYTFGPLPEGSRATSFRMLKRLSRGICRSAEKRTIRLIRVAEGFQEAKKL